MKFKCLPLALELETKPSFIAECFKGPLQPSPLVSRTHPSSLVAFTNDCVLRSCADTDSLLRSRCSRSSHCLQD
eukprot:1740121-Amphidinium_carterae.1